MSALGHLRPGPTSGRPANVCYASDRYRNDEPLKATRRATARNRFAIARFAGAGAKRPVTRSTGLR